MITDFISATRQWTPDATAKFDVLTRCGQWYPLRCIVVGEHRSKPCVELYDQPYSDKVSREPVFII